MPKTAQLQQKAPPSRWTNICNNLAAAIRGESENSTRLTGLASLQALVPGLRSSDLAAMVEDEVYGDIRSITTSTGAEYFYSSRHISHTYATFLVRAAAKDPAATIGETVRDESRIYPRPTKLALFVHPVFEIDRDALESYVDEVLARYPDLRKLTASTGAIYLYSTSFMNEGQAKSLMEWEEVEQYTNH